MSISIFAVLAIAFSVLAVLSFGAGPTLLRRLRRPDWSELWSWVSQPSSSR